jgi:hypothetical protein
VKTTLLLGLLSGAALFAQTPAPNKPKEDSLKKFAFLLGKWDAEGGGQPGTGMGAFSFDAELDRHILVRHNYAHYDKGAEAGTRHDDLLIVYLESSTEGPRAIYFDSEGHVIHYGVTTPKADSVVFESDRSQPGPRYRLSYTLKGVKLEGIFEVADSSSAPYKTYLTWTSTKK